MIVMSSLGLNNVNSHFRLAINLFVAFKTIYFNVAPHSMGVHSIIANLLLVTHAACEKITRPLQPACVVNTLLLLSLVFKCFGFLKKPPIYIPNNSAFYK